MINYSTLTNRLTATTAFCPQLSNRIQNTLYREGARIKNLFNVKQGQVIRTMNML